MHARNQTLNFRAALNRKSNASSNELHRMKRVLTRPIETLKETGSEGLFSVRKTPKIGYRATKTSLFHRDRSSYRLNSRSGWLAN